MWRLLESGEKVVLEVRKHWFIIFAEGAAIFSLAAAPLLVMGFVWRYFPALAELQLGGDLLALMVFGYFAWLLFLWIAFFVLWTDYYLDVWYITPKRIIDVEQKGLFWREVIDLRFEKVQDATVEIGGIIATLLNFGHIHVQTAAAHREIILRHAARPAEAKKVILHYYSLIMEKDNRPAGFVRNE